MFTVQSSEFINRPVADVFAFISDKENLPQWSTTVQTVELTSDRARAVGATYLLVEQPPIQKDKVEFQYTYTTYDKNKTVAGRGVSDKAPITGFSDYYQFDPHEQGTYVLIREEISPRGLLRLLQPFMRLMIGKIIQADLAKAKKVLESRA